MRPKIFVLGPDELAKWLAEESAKARIVTSELPIIEEIVRFDTDGGSTSDCYDCRGQCCFFKTINFRSAAGKHEFRELERLAGKYKNFDVVEANARDMFTSYSEDTLGWRDCWAGNSSWQRFYTDPLDKEKLVVGYACPMLNADSRCSVYPARPAVCAEFGRTEPEMFVQHDSHCNLVPIGELKGKKLTISGVGTYEVEALINV